MADVEGMKELLESMDELSLVMQKKLIVRALRKAGDIIKRRAAEKAPNDPNTPGNRIADNLAVSVQEQTANGAVVRVGVTSKGFVGRFHEYGTKNMRAHPWLGPAFDETQEDATTALAEDLSDGIDEALRG